jgi:uncharacterized protein (DUF427 family)
MAEQRGRVRVERGVQRIRAYVAGVAAGDTTRPLLVWENPHYPQYYIPADDAVHDVLVPTSTITHSPSRGDARHFTIKVGGTEKVDAAWQYTTSPIEELRDAIRFEWNAIDAWFAEDEEVYTHPRSPYTRIEILPSSRHVRVELDGVVLADTTHANLLLETGLPPRWYIPKVDARMDLLEHTDTVSHCPYKGQAEYWSARVGDRLETDVVWSYRTPLPESERVAGLISFYDDRVKVIVD